jgi:hypothetical protein
MYTGDRLTSNGFSKIRKQVVHEVVERLKKTTYLASHGMTSDEMAQMVAEGIFDLMSAEEDPSVVRSYIKWLCTTTTHEGKKSDRTVELLDTYESIVLKKVQEEETSEHVKEFFQMCREIADEKGKKPDIGEK